MRSYVYERIKLGGHASMITRYNRGEYLLWSIAKFLLFLFILWPLEIVLIVLLFVGEFVIRGILWLVKLPFCLAIKKQVPRF